MTKRTQPPDPLEPHPVVLDAPQPERAAKKPTRKKLGMPHIERPVKGCTCMQCEEHRKRDREAVRNAKLVAALEEVGDVYDVLFGAGATAALKSALRHGTW